MKPSQRLIALAQLMLTLTYQELHTVAADLHADTDEIDPGPEDVAANLHRWAIRTTANGLA